MDDGIFDWMDEGIAHNPGVLPKHCLDASGTLRKDLLHPAPPAYRGTPLDDGRELNWPQTR